MMCQVENLAFTAKVNAVECAVDATDERNIQIIRACCLRRMRSYMRASVCLRAWGTSTRQILEVVGASASWKISSSPRVSRRDSLPPSVSLTTAFDTSAAFPLAAAAV